MAKRHRAKRSCEFVLALAAACALPAMDGRAQVMRDDMVFLTAPEARETYPTLLEAARAYGLGYTELAAANLRLDPWASVAVDELVIPDSQIAPAAPRRGIVVNLADQRLYYFSPDNVLRFTAPVGIGGMDGETPTGATQVVNKRVDPTWIPTPSIRQRRPELPAVVPPGPDNPLGELALDLGWTSYVIHDTNRPLSIGRRLTSGCIRLYPEHIRVLFALVENGTPVTVVDQPVKVGWLDGDLYLQVHPTQSQAEEIEDTGIFTPAPATELAWTIASNAGGAIDRVDWRVVERAAAERSGIAVKITRTVAPSHQAAAALAP